MTENEAVAFREAVSSIRENGTGLRTDFRDLAKEVREALRMICDPLTGYIPRSEYNERHDTLRVEFDGRLREQAISVRWGVGTCISIGILMIAAFGTILGLGLHVSR